VEASGGEDAVPDGKLPLATGKMHSSASQNALRSTKDDNRKNGNVKMGKIRSL
jgi:hypothetical protein